MSDLVESLSHSLKELHSDIQDFIQNSKNKNTQSYHNTNKMIANPKRPESCFSEDDIAEMKMMAEILEESKAEIMAKFERIKKVIKTRKDIEEGKEKKKALRDKKEDKIIKIIKAKNELMKGINELINKDLLIQKNPEEKKDDQGDIEMQEGNKIPPIEITKDWIKQVSNLGENISYIRTPARDSLVHQIQWNTSILYQNSEERCEKPIVINPATGNIVRSGQQIVLHCSEPDAYIVFTQDGSIPGFTNGIRYDPQNSPIIVPEDISFIQIKFVACKNKMRDSPICVRTFKISNQAPDTYQNQMQMERPSAAIRQGAHVLPEVALDLGLGTPSSSNQTPQRNSLRMSSSHQYAPPSSDNDEDEKPLSDDSDDL